MEALGVLASGIAHDFNNMLTIIAGYSDLLISHMGDEKPLINEVQAIKQASDRAATLTSQLSTFGRRQGGSSTPPSISTPQWSTPATCLGA